VIDGDSNTAQSREAQTVESGRLWETFRRSGAGDRERKNIKGVYTTVIPVIIDTKRDNCHSFYRMFVRLSRGSEFRVYAAGCNTLKPLKAGLQTEHRGQCDNVRL
jgi:hypothetical protein